MNVLNATELYTLKWLIACYGISPISPSSVASALMEGG